MHVPEPGPLPGHRIWRGHPGQPAPPYPTPWASGPGPLPRDGIAAAPLWRIIVACAACALAGIAIGILLPRTPARTPAARPAPAATSSPAAAATPRAMRVPGSVAVYRLLPLSARQLRSAVGLAARSTAAYCTYSSTQTPTAWLAGLAGLRPYTIPTLQAVLTQAATDPALLQLRARQHTSVTCTPTATAIRDIASTSVTVVVTARQVTRTRSRTSTTSVGYAVTVAPGGGRWKVYDIQPATIGQAGGSLP